MIEETERKDNKSVSFISLPHSIRMPIVGKKETKGTLNKNRNIKRVFILFHTVQV